MAIFLTYPEASFVQFNIPPEDHCVHGVVDLPLPVVYPGDVAFQVVLNGQTEGEANSIFGATVNFGLVDDYGSTTWLLIFPNTAVKSKIAPTQILFNWGAGFPGFEAVVAAGECFRVAIELSGQWWYSKPFKRIAVGDDTCFTSKIEYSNEAGGFGFFGCGPAGGVGAWPDGEEPPVDEDGNCIPMIVEFNNVPNVTVPITSQMVDLYGEIPSTQIWLYDSNGILVNMGVSAQYLGGYPPSAIFIDLGGPASGVIRIGN